MRNYSRALILKAGAIAIATSAVVVIPRAQAMSKPSIFLGLFFPEPLPSELATSKYRAFRAILPSLVIRGQLRSVTLTPEGKLSVVVEEQATCVPKKDASDQSESHILLAPGGVISPELIGKP